VYTPAASARIAVVSFRVTSRRATPLESSIEVEACEGAASKTKAGFEGIGASRYEKEIIWTSAPAAR
jgi:hypothetical protein